jgi:hypothetical protein
MVGAPVFIVGTPRSGTTLTAYVLRRQRSLFADGEASFVEDIYSRRGALGEPAVDPAAQERVIERLRTLYGRYNSPGAQAYVDRVMASTDLSERLRRASGYADLYRTFMDGQARAAGKTRWINHAPKDVFHMEDILELFPDAQFVICTRHVLDFLVSYRDHFQRDARRQAADNAERLRRLYHPITTSLLWRASMYAASRGRQRWPERVILNRYEDLVADPARQVARLCAFLGEESDPGMLAVATNNSSRAVDAPGIFNSSVGQWRTRISEAEAWLALRLCAGALRALDYEVPAVRPSWPQVGRWIGNLPLYGLSALRANSGRRGSSLYYFSKRLSALLHAR